MKYYIGIDGGGTKTAIGLFDESLNELKKVKTVSVHPLQVTLEQGIFILREALSTLCTQEEMKHVQAIGAGFGGYGNTTSLVEQIEQMCASVFEVPYSIKSDAEIAHIGALNNQEGILLIAGTGSIAYANRNGQFERSGGWGYQIGDEGSAYWIAKQMVYHFSKQVDGRIKETPLKQMLMEYFQISNPYDLISIVSLKLANDRTQYSNLAMISSSLLSVNDESMFQIVEEAAYELAQMANSLGKNFEGDVPVSYIGGTWQIGEPLLTSLKKQLSQNLILQEPLHDALYGAAFIAKENFKTN